MPLFTTSVHVDPHLIPSSSAVKNLDVIMDSLLRMQTHINSICHSSYNQLRDIAKLKCFMDKMALETSIQAFVSMRLDYCNLL